MSSQSTYFDKLKDPRWQRRRLEIFQRDEWACVYCCSKTDTLNVHHLAYVRGREPWAYPDSLLVTTCEPCHALAETARHKLLQTFGKFHPRLVEQFAQTIRDYVLGHPAHDGLHNELLNALIWYLSDYAAIQDLYDGHTFVSEHL